MSSLVLSSLMAALFRYCVRVAPAMANRIVDSARSVLNKYLPDVYIYTDVVRGREVGKYIYAVDLFVCV